MSRGVVLWSARLPDPYGPATRDLLLFDGGLPGVVVQLDCLLDGDIGDGIAALRAPHGVGCG